MESAPAWAVRRDQLRDTGGAATGRTSCSVTFAGAFTGAINDKPGRLEAGSGGTVLFDEIAELPTSLQIKFLRFVQDR